MAYIIHKSYTGSSITAEVRFISFAMKNANLSKSTSFFAGSIGVKRVAIILVGEFQNVI